MKKNENLEISERRDSIVNAINKAIKIFTSHSETDFNDVMNNGLHHITEAVSLDRVVFYRRMIIDGEIRFGQIYLWDKQSNSMLSLDEELRILPKIPVIEYWISTLLNGKCIRTRESEMTEDELSFLRQFNVKSILIVPVFSHGELWGAVSLQDHVNDAYFDEGCMDLLYSTALLCANAVIRAEKTQNAAGAINSLKRRERMANMLNKIAVTFLSYSEKIFEDMMNSGVGLITDAANLDRVSVWRNTKNDDGLYASQIYRWDRESGGTTDPTQGLADLAYSKFAPRWEELFARGESINSPVRLLPEAELLKSFKIVSAFISPVFINKTIWGFVLFEDRRSERFFEDDSTELMRSAAFLCANTVIRYEMERGIATANEFNRATLEATPIGFTIFDENLRIIDCNNVILDTLGTTKDYYIEHFFDFSPYYQPDGSVSKDKGIEILQKALDGNKQVSEWQYRTNSGDIIPFEITLTRALFNGKYIILGYQYDLLNIKKINEKFIKQSEQLQTRLEQQELISEISRSFISSGEIKMLIYEAIARLGRYHKVSRVLIFSLDYQSGDAELAYHWSADCQQPKRTKINMRELIKASFPERLYDCATMPILSSADTSTSKIEVFQELLADNVHAFICAPLYVEGSLWGMLATEQYDAPRKWSSSEKNFIVMTASTIAGAIMMDIYNSKLKDAVKQLTEASKAKSEFLSNMSHEIRTPMNAIINMTAIAKHSTDMERKNHALNKIEDASIHLLGVINDILDMSKIEANKFDLAPADFNFEKMLQRVVNVINFRIEEKRQKLRLHIDKDIPVVLIGDDQRLSQVVTNLFSNAVKFTPENGSITLDARFLGEENEMCTIQISIIDSGIGISAEQQKRLFKSFQQAETSTVRKYGGTGLGLSISKSIVEMMGGKIWIESEPGKGSTFAFTIQVKRGEERKYILKEKIVNWDIIRILAVDDDSDILAFFSDVAKRFNINCDTAICGEKALELIEKNGGYDLYFVDWIMPGMDGIALTNAIKGKVINPEKAIVVMISANEWGVIKDGTQNAGVNKYLSKPLFPSVIKDIIIECLGTERSEIEDTVENDDIFTGRRILLAEDVEINREIVLTLLEPTKLKIDCAENGVQAVQMFKNNPDKYEMIFMDVQMPEMDGYQATRHIRNIEADLPLKHRRIPIVAMTANVFLEDIENCKNAGMDDHIGKPLDFEIVMEKLRHFLR
ncbi:MAG: response regulator [Treponema sp.]|nr:response regulator [Treponema sp.]